VLVLPETFPELIVLVVILLLEVTASQIERKKINHEKRFFLYIQNKKIWLRAQGNGT